MTIEITRDLQGFRDAMAEMRQVMGQDVPFFIPAAKTYPPGTQLDPESGEPYDPTIQRLDSSETRVVVHCGVYRKIPNVVDDISQSALGPMEERDALLDVSPTDYENKSLEDATSVEILGERYEIVDADPDGIAEVEHRILVYIRRQVQGG